ncbi:hypothetical protein [Streptomyces cyaneofuscatus]|uniref:hypothetical protein n=1 Tax=Streptomyces cyaneofuscatus TaxID=66883 RepID=UPI0033BE6D3F
MSLEETAETRSSNRSRVLTFHWSSASATVPIHSTTAPSRSTGTVTIRMWR